MSGELGTVLGTIFWGSVIVAAIVTFIRRHRPERLLTRAKADEAAEEEYRRAWKRSAWKARQEVEHILRWEDSTLAKHYGGLDACKRLHSRLDDLEEVLRAEASLDAAFSS